MQRAARQRPRAVKSMHSYCRAHVEGALGTGVVGQYADVWWARDGRTGRMGGGGAGGDADGHVAV